MTTSGRAEEIAREILVKITSWASLPPSQYPPVTVGIDLIAKVLENYAREAYQKGLQAHPCCCESKEDCDHEDQGFEKGAAEMRERAAKVALNHECERASDYCHISISKEIKSLPLTPTQTKTTTPDLTHGGKDKEAGNG